MAEGWKVIFKHYHLVLVILTILLALSIYYPTMLVSPAVVATFTVGFLLGILYERFEREDC